MKINSVGGGNSAKETTLRHTFSGGALMMTDDFTASNGWMERFRSRCSITFVAVHGEAGDVDEGTINNWKYSKLQDLTRGYAPEDIWNWDEFALLYKCLPDRTMMVKGK